MKLVSFILVVFFIVTCSTQKASINENTKFLQVKRTFGEDTLDTINKSFTRVYKSTEVYRVDFSFTENESERIIEVIYHKDFFTLPDSLPVLQPVIYFGNCGEEFLEVTLNDQKKSVFWNSCALENSQEFSRLRDVMTEIQDIIRSRKEIKELPEQGWY